MTTDSNKDIYTYELIIIDNIGILKFYPEIIGIGGIFISKYIARRLVALIVSTTIGSSAL